MKLKNYFIIFCLFMVLVGCVGAASAASDSSMNKGESGVGTTDNPIPVTNNNQALGVGKLSASSAQGENNGGNSIQSPLTDNNSSKLSESAGVEYYVSVNGSDDNSGNQTSPFATISKALSIADPAKNVVIYVAEGTYNDGNKNLEIALSNVASGGSLSIIGEGNGTLIDTVYSAPFITSISANSIVTIKNMKFYRCKSVRYSNGGVINNNGYLTVDNCVFEDAQAYQSSGGAIAFTNYNAGNLTVINSYFKNSRSSSGDGGAIYASSQMPIIIENNTFDSCWQGNDYQGAAVYASGEGILRVVGNYFYSTTALGSNRRDSSLTIWARNGEVINNTFENCNFTGNNGGIVYASGQKNYFSGNKFINANAPNGLIYVESGFNYLVEFENVTTTRTNFVLTANITDIDGNPICSNPWGNELTFTLNGESVGSVPIKNGASTLEVSKLLDNGEYVINATFQHPAYNATFKTGTLTVNIDRTPVELWVDDASGEDNETAGSKTKPFKSIKYAIEQGISKSINITIHVNDGVYSGVNNTGMSINALCDIYILGESAEGTIIDGEFQYPIFTSISANTVATIKDISFINAKGSSNGATIYGQGPLTVDNCIFINDTANRGGAIYLSSNSAFKTIVSNSKFINCSSDVYITLYAKTGVVTFVNNTVINTTESYSAYIYADNMDISNNTFANSRATSGNAFYLYVSSYRGNITIDANKFMNASSSSVRSVIYLEGDETNAIVTNNEFDNIKLFTTNYAGAIYLDRVNAYLNNNTFTNSTIASTIFFNGGTINSKIVLSDGQADSHKFTLKANVTDVDGNPITANTYYKTWVHFYANGTEIGKTQNIKNGAVTLDASKVLENGVYELTASIELLNLTEMVPATLTVNITTNPKEYYISENGDDENGTGTNDKPFKTLKKALDQAYVIDKSYDVTIHVLDGTFSGEGNVNLFLNDSSAGVLRIIGETYGKAIFDGNGFGSMFWDSAKQSTPAIPSTLEVSFENLKFINFGNDNWYGTLIYSDASELNVTNCIFDSFYFYGGNAPVISNRNGKLNIKNSLFNNITTKYGYIVGDYTQIGKFTMDNTTFTNINSGYSIVSDVSELSNSEFINCTCNGWSSDAYPVVYVKKISVLENNTFNNITAMGGAVRANGEVTIINNTFIGNTAKSKSVITAYSTVNIINSTFINNTGIYGGAIYANAYVNLSNVTFDNNAQSGVLNDIYIDNNGKVSGLTLVFNNIVSTITLNEIIAELSSDEGAIVSGGSVEFYVNGTNVGSQQITNNLAVVNYDFGQTGEFILNGTYAKGDDSFIIVQGVALILEVTPSNFTDLYVSDSMGSDDNNGSIDSPFKTIKKAVYYAYGHDNVTIHVLEGTYKGLQNTNILIDTTKLTIEGAGDSKTIIDGENLNYFFNIVEGHVEIKDLTLTNGFASSSHTQIAISNISSVVLENIKYENNTGVAVGDYINMGIVNNGALTIKNSTFNNNGKNKAALRSGVILSNQYSVLEVYNSTFTNNIAGFTAAIGSSATTFVMDNCTFRDNEGRNTVEASGLITSSRFIHNAGISLQTGGKVLNCNFTDNYAKGGDSGVGITGNGYVSGCLFINNSAAGSGGAMFFTNGEIYNCQFYNNTAASLREGAGGAICAFGTGDFSTGGGNNNKVTIGNCYFEGNQALASGGAAMTTGGGAIMNYVNLIVIDCTFVDNYAVHRGGAIRNGEGYDNAVLTVYNSTFINNRAGNNGGAITAYVDPSQVSAVGTIHIHSSEFINNNAGVTGGAIEIFRTNADIDDCLFDGNTALNGGAISTSSKTTIKTSNFTSNNGFAGGAIRVEGDLVILKSVFEANTASTGGAIDIVGGNLKTTYSVFVDNTADSFGSAIFEGSANTHITDLSNNWWGINDNPNQFIYSNYTIDSWVVANLSPNINEILVGESTDFTVNFTDNNNATLADSIPARALYVNNSAYPLIDNGASFTVPAEKAGPVTISVDNQVFDLEVVNPTPKIEITFSKNPVYGNNITVTVNVKGNGSIPTGSVIVTINGKDYKVDLTNGKAIAEIGILDASNYPVTVNYSGDDNYSKASASDSLTVTRAKPHFEIHVESIEYGQVEIVNVTADRLFNDTVLLYISGQPYDVPVVNGFGSINFTDLTPTAYTVNTYFTGNSNYVNEDAGPVTFSVTKANVKLNVIAKDINVGATEYIVIESTPKVDGSITIKLNSKMASDYISEGIATVKYKNLEVGTYEFVVIYAGDEYHNSATAKATFNVYEEYIVTNSTFSNFFDSNGNLRNNITSDNLTFVGEFSNLGVDALNITKSVDLIGEDAVLNDIGLIISADDVTVDNFEINLSNESGANAAITVTGDDVVVKNSNINVDTPADKDSFAVLVEGAEDFALINNTINYTGNSDGSAVNNAIRLEDADGAVIVDNTMDITLPSVPVTYTPPTWEATVLSEGIRVDSSDDVVLSGNEINVDYNKVTGAYDTIYAVEFTDSDNAVVSDNEITTNGNSYAYGISMNGDDFTIDSNNISTTGNNYANGIQIAGPATGDVTGNNINAEAPKVVYPVYSYGTDVTYEDNNISGTSNSVYGMELFGTNETVKNNNIVTNGNFTIGVASGSGNLVLENNTILANGTNKGTPTTGDSIKSETTGVKAVSGNAKITNNKIKSNGETTINTTASGTINNNNLVAKAYTGDASVNYVPGKTTLSNNVPTMKRAVLSADDVEMYYKDGTRYVVKLTDFEGNPLANENVTITINGMPYDRTTNANGTASIALNLNSGNYTVSAYYAGAGIYTNASVESNVNILSTVNGDDVVKVFRNATQYYATFVDAKGNPLAKDTEVKFNINGVMYTRKTNENGTAKLNINLQQGTYVITAINPINGEMHTNNITVLPTIANNKDLVKYYKNDSQYVVTLIGNDGKAVGAGEKVTFNINGVFYTRTTNATGQAKLNINLGPGTYVITAEYKECKVSNTITVKPVLSAKDLVKKYGTSDQFVANLVDGQGKPYAGQTVKFNINGVFYYRNTTADGQAKLNIRLMPGEYIITSSYNGANIANTVKIEA